MVKNVIRDKHPQWFNMKVLQAVVNTYTEAVYSTPCANYGEDPVVMELLKVYFYGGKAEYRNVSEPYTELAVLKKSQGVNPPTPELSDVVAFAKKQTTITDTAATDATIAGIFPTDPHIVDLSDGQGNGMIFANKTMILGINSATNVAVQGGAVKILFRLKRVSATELIGILSE